ncbi:MAG TPA: alpha-amylase family glycosyl hydrolase, partial [Isosphaeraceae bacterium]|nr:alpha-amylase family glycosyl hydrolase [Isosphaeraceae bacterium]
MSTWQPSLGAWFDDDEARFRVWAPDASSVTIRLESPAPPREIPMLREFQGYHTQRIGGLEPGDRYRYLVDNRGPFPDPASRWQPQGVHGPSALVDPSRYLWNDASFAGVDRDDLVIYELHVGTFTPEGTFASATRRLSYLRELGISAVELMPLADFPGSRNWGYDGVNLFAPARCYGHPDDLRRFVDQAHQLGLSVLLDVVYNHLGPEGAYYAEFMPFFTRAHQTPWGDGV